jgi:soluble lytic murein transglycosylase-like protein
MMISDAGNAVIERAAILALIRELAAVHGVPWELCAAIVEVESAFDPYAIRYESAYRWLVGDETALSATERMQQMTSWGLMQVMGGVAREYGFVGYCSRLCIPRIGLHYGLLHLAKFHRRYPDWHDVIASYNAGRPAKRDGAYLNQGYVDKVLAAWGRYDVPVPIKDTEV